MLKYVTRLVTFNIIEKSIYLPFIEALGNV